MERNLHLPTASLRIHVQQEYPDFEGEGHIQKGDRPMKTAPFLALFLTLPVPAAFSQAAGAYAGAAAAMSGSAQAAGRSTGAATSQVIGANASATERSVAGSAQESTAAAAQADKTSTSV